MIFVLLMLSILLGYYFYTLYFKDYVDVRKTFKILIKTLNVRDLLVMQIIPSFDIFLSKDVTGLIEKRIGAKMLSHNEQISLDIELNKTLKGFYEQISQGELAPVEKSVFEKIIFLEKKLKNIRKSYNECVLKYNDNLISHKKICMIFLRMKPIDTYGIKR